MENDELKVSVQSLQPASFSTWGRKQGGSIKTWKRRWFVLKEDRVWYFAGKNDVEAKGFIELPPGTDVRDCSATAKKPMFSINSRGPKGARVFYIVTENPSDLQAFMAAINKTVGGPKPPQPAPAAKDADPSASAAAAPQPQPPTPALVASPRSKPAGSSPRNNIYLIKGLFSWMQNETENIVEFWKYWVDSTPLQTALEGSQTVSYNVVISGNTDKLSWRVFGSQEALTQPMVEFFWNVGAPEEEINLLNELGCQINPTEIGTWIDMSVMNGMDGGWFFREELSINYINDTADKSVYATQLIDWAKRNNLLEVCQLGRDMGATPPRQAEFRFRLEMDLPSRINAITAAFEEFKKPPVPPNIISVLSALPSSCGFFFFTVVVSSEGIVKLSVLVPDPGEAIAIEMLRCMDDVNENHIEFHRKVMDSLSDLPSFVEYTFLAEGYGYDVYKEGHDVLIHYNLGTEMA